LNFEITSSYPSDKWNEVICQRLDDFGHMSFDGMSPQGGALVKRDNYTFRISKGYQKVIMRLFEWVSSEMVACTFPNVAIVDVHHDPLTIQKNSQTELYE
jgi:hypothetical protein